MKVGIDFGSTYSTIAKYNETDDSVEALHLEEGAPVSIPSSVSVAIDGSISCGDAAKIHTGSIAYTVYDGFKMLIAEPDKRILAARQYTDKYTPRYITKCYLQSLLSGVLKRFGAPDEKLDEVYICVPEIWSSKINTLDGRNILMDILKNDMKRVPVGNVNIVTEPEAASAFFAHNYERETKKCFNGYLLLIDYGGGTLDITLTQVISDGNGRMEIGYREGGGAGENHPDGKGYVSIGNAGLAYIQQVLLTAFADCGITIENCSEPAFKKAAVAFEKSLKAIDGIKKIEDRFSEYDGYSNFGDIMFDAPSAFTFVEYKDRPVTITYQHLWQAYKETIETVVSEQIKDINKRVKAHIGADPCQPSAGDRDDFKIALVGGFGSFYLVRSQIFEIYNITSNSKKDKRIKNISKDKSEQAISLGAALLASGRVVLQKTARYSIGLCTMRSTDKKKGLYYGIVYHQQLMPGKPYFICYNNSADDSPRNRIKYTNLRNNMNELAIGFSDNLNKYVKLPLRNEMLYRLEKLPVEEICFVGFSINDNDVVSLHIVPYYGGTKGMVIPLDSYANMFDMTAVEEEDINEV